MPAPTGSCLFVIGMYARGSLNLWLQGEIPVGTATLMMAILMDGDITNGYAVGNKWLSPAERVIRQLR